MHLVIRMAFALNILFKIPVWVRVLLTGFSTSSFLASKDMVRKLEIQIAILVFVMAGCFFGEMSYLKPPTTNVLKGMFVPKLSGQGATGDTIALLGALIMPHNLFLHSTLVLSQKIQNSVRRINDSCRYFFIESGIALFVAFLINGSMIAISGTICSAKNLTTDKMNVLGKSSSNLYAIALLAYGQSSTITSTYVGQYIMQKVNCCYWILRLARFEPFLIKYMLKRFFFLEKFFLSENNLMGFRIVTIATIYRMWKSLRNLITRCIAITPSLIVSIIGGSSGAGRLIIIPSMILSFELPFASFRFSRIGLIVINIYYLITTFVHWLIRSRFPKVGNVLIGIIVFSVMAIYIL
ncbi:hypothetical protein OSB04_020805 [Centaurea solstitialis]|uniref:Uncharacterized protein n=1 Tax=Centaurea solstitialis TaxID=347529 RepID=A0AA38TBE3_9ASTR|nr:hypothetical protein OSB04_020805 [Centaurea solstitialis]